MNGAQNVLRMQIPCNRKAGVSPEVSGAEGIFWWTMTAFEVQSAPDQDELTLARLQMAEAKRGAYGADDDIVDYILGITFEIWEQRGVELVHQYYADDCVVWGIDGITHGSQAVVDSTWATLEAFPDRNLLAENVIWSGNRRDGYYTSHRLLSRATNRGATVYGPATGINIRMKSFASLYPSSPDTRTSSISFEYRSRIDRLIRLPSS